MRLLSFNLLLSFGITKAQDHSGDGSKDMLPVEFFWPPGRIWDSGSDNTGPCGSLHLADSRAEFPMLNGQIALTVQSDKVQRLEVSISHHNAPTSNNDFEFVKALLAGTHPGPACYPIPNPPVDVNEGSNATIQIKYDGDSAVTHTQMHYACADIVYVPTSRFDHDVPCFSASFEDFSVSTGKNDNDNSTTNGVVYAPPSNVVLSGGAIAGIVFAILGFIGMCAAAFFLWGRHKYRQRQRERAAKVRAVPWKRDIRASSSASGQEDGDVALRDLNK